MEVKDLIGHTMDDKFVDFNLDEIVPVLQSLKNENAIDLPHAELLQQQALRAADILAEHLGKIVKMVSYLESQINTTKNRAALNFTPKSGDKAPSMELRKMAGEAAPELEELSKSLAQAKGAKVALEKKYDILIKAHHHFKDISNGLRKSILG